MAGKRPPKVMRIIARLNVGGPALHCLLLSTELERRGFESVLVFGQPADGEASYQELFDKRPEFQQARLISLPRMSRLPSVFGDLKSFFQLLRLIHKEKPQIIHTHTAKAGVLGRIAATLMGVPVVVHTFHGHVLRGYFSDRMSRLITRIEQLLARMSSALITLSPALKHELSQDFQVARPQRFRIIPLGRDLEGFHACATLKGQLRAELGLKPEDAIVGCVGRLVPIKNHRLLLEAHKRLQALRPQPVHLVLVGQGELAEELKNEVKRLELEHCVHFLGWRSDLPKLYADFDLLALSSDNEGTPLSIIESFAASCPVVSTRVGGVADMFHEPDAALEESLPEAVELRAEGALVPAKQPQALAEALSLLLSSQKLRARCAAAALQASTHYSENRLADRMASLYRELLG